jgi:hypothetical protein
MLLHLSLHCGYANRLDRLRSAFARIVFRLFQTQYDPVGNLIPILKLNPTPDDGQTRGPIFFGCTVVLFGNRRLLSGGTDRREPFNQRSLICL